MYQHHPTFHSTTRLRICDRRASKMFLILLSCHLCTDLRTSYHQATRKHPYLPSCCSSSHLCKLFNRSSYKHLRLRCCCLQSYLHMCCCLPKWSDPFHAFYHLRTSLSKKRRQATFQDLVHVVYLQTNCPRIELRLSANKLLSHGLCRLSRSHRKRLRRRGSIFLFHWLFRLANNLHTWSRLAKFGYLFLVWCFGSILLRIWLRFQVAALVLIRVYQDPSLHLDWKWIYRAPFFCSITIWVKLCSLTWTLALL